MSRNLRPLMCNSQKILPLAFEDSLSYYEQVCKLTYRMNEMINVLNGNIDDNLKNYIDNRFNAIMLDTMYDSEAETLTLFIANKEV